MEKKILSENTTHVYYKDGTVKRKPTSDQKQPLEDSKEGLHTQDKSFVIKMGEIKVASEREGDEYACNILDKDERFIAKVIAVPYYSYEQAEQMAKYFCQAVNERKALLNSHRELLDTLEMELWAEENGEVEAQRQDRPRYIERLEKIRTVINNAKNI